MTTPSTMFPFSPSPSSPSVSELASFRPTDDRRRSKRDSTASSSRKREEAATRYPSPPIGTRSRPQSMEASLQIPPYNPNGRVASGTRTPSMPTSESTTSIDGDRFGGMMPPRSAAPAHQTSHRPASAAVFAVPPPAPSNSVPTGANSRVRQSVGYLPTHMTPSGAGPYPQLYTPHPMPRQKIYFGPYILLQTLGEGEFGKVKLGIHSERWGEEVAIKLIKRGNVDTAQRGEKVRREIEVLKSVRHPNIVRLYDVIETEKYIGIVLEYASGGELFDHILAHRYLKEREASRFFAQLISGVSYLHAKGIVHRDLKLENLLLERGALQITDFGFANRFEHATNDLMATSCGSPCYAAPELVVQEGKYVGTAVDVWSCGVILYAMLAGYLPYDDDPANPEGDNINLLYKYIINTQLSFPDWITAEPRSLLLMMLVPNPEHRCTIEDVTRHSWLRKYASTFSNSVEELETQAQEAEMAKRQALEAQRQFLMQQQAMQSQVAAGGMSASEAMTRSQSNNAAQKHRSAIVTSSTPQYTVVVPPSVPEESPSGRARTVVLPYQHSSRRSGIVAPNSPTIQSHPVSVDVDSFSYDARRLSSGASSVPMSFAASAPSIAPVDHIMADAEVPPTPSRTSRRSSTQQASAISTAAAVAAEVEKRKKSHRATVQLEYDGGAAIARTPDAIPLPASPVPLEETSIDMVIDEAPASHVEPSIAEEIPTAAPVELSEAALATAAVTTAIAVAIPTPSSPLPSVAAVPFPSTPPRTPSSPAGSTRARLASSDVPPVPVLPTSEAPIVDANVTPKGSRKTSTTSHATVTGVSSPRPPSAASSALSKHGKSASSSDRFSLRAFLPGATTKVSTTDRAKAAEVRREADAVAKEKVLEEVTNRRQSRRQKALSLQPFRQSTTKVAKVTKVEPTVVTGVQTRSSTAATTGSMGPPPKPSVPVRPLSTRASTATTFDTDSSSQAPGTPSGKARAVMDWFRRRSTRGVPVAEAPRTAIATDFDRYRPAITHARPPSDTGTAMQEAPVAPSPSIPKAPAVVVTSAVIPTAPSYPAGTDRSEPSSRSASGAQSHLSQLTTSTMATTASRGSLIPTAQAVFSDSKLRIHQGALDRAAVTSRLPPVIILEVRNALWNMGIDVVQEGEFKLKCVRRSREKSMATTGSISISPVLSGAGDRRSVIASSPSITSGLTASPSVAFRSFFARRTSYTNLQPSPDPSLSTYDNIGSPLSPVISAFAPSNQPLPVYGEAMDGGDEIRFYVEIARVKHLEGLYCVEVKRMRGGQWGYKAVYDVLIKSLDLGVS